MSDISMIQVNWQEGQDITTYYISNNEHHNDSNQERMYKRTIVVVIRYIFVITTFCTSLARRSSLCGGHGLSSPLLSFRSLEKTRQTSQLRRGETVGQHRAGQQQ